MKSHDEFVLEILQEHWRIESDFIGEETLRDIIVGNIQFETVSTGEKLDTTTILLLLVSASTFVKTVLEIVEMFRNLKKKPTEDQIKLELVVKGVPSSVLEDKKILLVISDVIKKHSYKTTDQI